MGLAGRLQWGRLNPPNFHWLAHCCWNYHIDIDQSGDNLHLVSWSARMGRREEEKQTAATINFISIFSFIFGFIGGPPLVFWSFLHQSLLNTAHYPLYLQKMKNSWTPLLKMSIEQRLYIKSGSPPLWIYVSVDPLLLLWDVLLHVGHCNILLGKCQ